MKLKFKDTVTTHLENMESLRKILIIVEAWSLSSVLWMLEYIED